MDVITIGETMAAFIPEQQGLLRYNNIYKLKIAGAESNLAVGLSKLGHKAGWLSAVGDDEFGHFIINQIRSEGVDTSHVMICPEYRTGVMFKEIHPGRETSVFYYRENSAVSHIKAEQLPWSYIEQAKIIHLTGITPVLSQDLQDTVLSLIERMDSGTRISFDPNIRRKLWGNKNYAELIHKIANRSHILMMGVEEAQEIYGISRPDMLAEELFKNSILEYLAIKDGANGAHVYDSSSHYYIPPFKCCPVDMIGAGDAFNAGFLSGILEGRDLQTCGNMGGIAGAMATEVSGDTEGYPLKKQMVRQLEGTCGEVYR